jgi:hypothetical protein
MESEVKQERCREMQCCQTSPRTRTGFLGTTSGPARAATYDPMLRAVRTRQAPTNRGAKIIEPRVALIAVAIEIDRK